MNSHGRNPSDRVSLNEPRQGRFRARLIPRDQDDAGAHLSERFRSDFASQTHPVLPQAGHGMAGIQCAKRESPETGSGPC
ncbi:MAG: hypothetical protein WA858_30445, partial [Xanthobacteraceae bacterium]